MDTTEQTNLDNQPELEPQPAEIAPAPRRFSVWIAIAAVIVLAGAAFLGARLINARPTAGGPQMLGGGPGQGPAMMSFKLDIIPAAELPARTPDKLGLVTEVKDKSLMVVDGGKISVSIDEGGNVNTTAEDANPPTEVVVTSETKIYRDATFDHRKPENEEQIQQVIEPFEFSAIDKDSSVSVWGYKRGDRLIAEVILYSQPIVFKQGE